MRAKQVCPGVFNPLILFLFMLQMPCERKGNIQLEASKLGEAFD